MTITKLVDPSDPGRYINLTEMKDIGVCGVGVIPHPRFHDPVKVVKGVCDDQGRTALCAWTKPPVPKPSEHGDYVFIATEDVAMLVNRADVLCLQEKVGVDRAGITWYRRVVPILWTLPGSGGWTLMNPLDGQADTTSA